MTETELEAHELVRRKEWSRAVDLYDELLGNGALGKQISKERVVACLLGRSECCLELGRHEAVVSDCRRIIKLLADGHENSTGARARRRLVHALYSLRRFSEAEMATREWMALNSSPEAVKMLERLSNMIQAACTYCAMTFRDKAELRAHCATEQHQRVIMSDEGRDWIWRPPPRGHTGDSYQLCEAHAETGTCRYGAQCADAHGPDELSEWRERFEYRRMRLQRAQETELYGKSYTEQLLERWLGAPSPDRVMRERLDFVQDSCSSDLVTAVSSKTSCSEWTFILRTRRQLRAVALLQDAHRNHFSITNVGNDPLNNDQEWVCAAEPTDETEEPLDHRVTVQFRTDIFGTFRQSVVFDFGSEPILVKQLCVDVLPAGDADRIKEIKREIAPSSCERWTEENAEVIAYEAPPYPGGLIINGAGDEWERSLLAAYPCPSADSFTLTHATVADKRATRNNYRSRMHELLCVEEMARYEQVARYNLTARLRVARSYMLAPNGTATSTAKYSHSGELFALMQLGRDVSEDTPAGRLVLSSCTTVLIGVGVNNEVRRRVYEALVEDKGKNVIYLRLSARCVTELTLEADTDLECDVQFQLNRLPYCEWHHAVDRMHDLRVIFPDVLAEPAIPWNPTRQWPDTGAMDAARLNAKQREAVVAITTPIDVPLPPVLIIGPFGTGKTYTLAQALRQVLRQRDTRVLVCTHSNSAADLYVKDYLHGWVESGCEEARPLRVYYHRRWVATVHPTVQKYCLIEETTTAGGARHFRPPTLDEISSRRVVVGTLSISMWLSTIGLPRGHFTHILLDEAAQAMECEAVMPLALADRHTRVVLAGDHMQMSPELFSPFAKERNLHVSLLERLYDHYPAHYPCKILLCENYRAHEAIIRFTSELFYEQKLVASGRQPRHDRLYPLTFFTARGEDVQERNSTAFYNCSEVYEVVERVCELRKRWPAAWGRLDDQSIGIMTPYADQVFRIRSELRKRRMPQVSVERVLNVQGKQFRAIFLSTVRTRRTCAQAHDDVDYGFLSNSKLLNTAITRAQSLVAVVGDPVALCSIGRCRKVWERFIEICNQNQSLYGITWQLLRSQLDGVELKKTYVLNPLAPEFVPRHFVQQQHDQYMVRRSQQVQGYVPPRPPPAYVTAPPPPAVVPYAPAPPPSAAAPVFFIPSTGTGAVQQTAQQTQFTAPAYAVRPPPPTAYAWGGVPFPLGSPPQVKNTGPRSPIGALQLLAVQRPPDIALPDKEHIQFFQNVHFPERGPSLEQLLPPGVSPQEMLQAPQAHQLEWCRHLQDRYGTEAAQRFIDLMSAAHRPHHQQSQSRVPWGATAQLPPVQQQSVPLYRRQGTQQQLPSQIRPQSPPCLPQTASAARQADWQRQINAEFAAMNLGVTESLEDMLGRTYASVLRDTPPEKPPQDPFAVLRDLGQRCAQQQPTPQLYQYFS